MTTTPAPAIELLLTCPICKARHIDVGEFRTKLHHTHSCQKCGHTWRPAIENTVGVRFLRGFRNGFVEGDEVVFLVAFDPFMAGMTTTVMRDQAVSGRNRLRVYVKKNPHHFDNEMLLVPVDRLMKVEKK